jgi:hypothetical protein
MGVSFEGKEAKKPTPVYTFGVFIVYDNENVHHRRYRKHRNRLAKACKSISVSPCLCGHPFGFGLLSCTWFYRVKNTASDVAQKVRNSVQRGAAF